MTNIGIFADLAKLMFVPGFFSKHGIRGRHGRALNRVFGKYLPGQRNELLFCDHLAAAVELRIEIDLQALDVKISVYFAGCLQGKGVLYIEIAVDFPPEIHVVADDVAFDDRFFSDHYLGLGTDLAFETTVNPNVVR